MPTQTLTNEIREVIDKEIDGIRSLVLRKAIKLGVGAAVLAGPTVLLNLKHFPGGEQRWMWALATGIGKPESRLWS